MKEITQEEYRKIVGQIKRYFPATELPPEEPGTAFRYKGIDYEIK